MAIGTAGAIIGSAVIGAGVNALGASSAAKSANKAAKANNALEREIYEKNAAALAPYQSMGTAANGAIGALLGLDTGNDVDWTAYVRANPDALANWNAVRGTQNDTFGGDIAKFGQYHYDKDGARRDLTPFTSSQVGAQNAAFDNFRNSTGYQFRVDEGNKNITAALGKRGGLESGGAKKALAAYGQNIASDEFWRYYGALTGQQGVGLSSASAQAGVGQGYAGAVSANNNNAANASGNAALSFASGVNNTLASGLSAYGMQQGMRSSYSQPAPQLPYDVGGM